VIQHGALVSADRTPVELSTSLKFHALSWMRRACGFTLNRSSFLFSTKYDIVGHHCALKRTLSPSSERLNSFFISLKVSQHDLLFALEFGKKTAGLRRTDQERKLEDVSGWLSSFGLVRKLERLAKLWPRSTSCPETVIRLDLPLSMSIALKNSHISPPSSSRRSGFPSKIK
jgi:hypothetical protein